MVYLDQWGPLRHAANAAFICLQVSYLTGVTDNLFADSLFTDK
jgi:hypothetical protein